MATAKSNWDSQMYSKSKKKHKMKGQPNTSAQREVKAEHQEWAGETAARKRQASTVYTSAILTYLQGGSWSRALGCYCSATGV